MSILVQPEEKIESKSLIKSELIVLNDDINTFDHVIDILIKYCNHSSEQAEQCTWIIHYKGKCSVKVGAKEELIPIKRAILDAGISAEVR